MATFSTPFVALRAARAVYRLVQDPTRLNEVFRIADAMESGELAEKVAQEFHADPRHREALAARPRVGRIDLAALSRLPSGTLGRAFADFARQAGIDPSDIEVNDVRTEFDYIRAHLRETHDIWHVATGFGTDVAGELGLQAFYLAQFRAPLAVMLLGVGMANTLFFAMDDREHRMDEIARGWLLGKRATTLFGYRWAENWAKPLAEVRAELGLDLEALDDAMDRAFRARSTKAAAAHAA